MAARQQQQRVPRELDSTFLSRFPIATRCDQSFHAKHVDSLTRKRRHCFVVTFSFSGMLVSDAPLALAPDLPPEAPVLETVPKSAPSPWMSEVADHFMAVPADGHP